MNSDLKCSWLRVTLVIQKDVFYLEGLGVGKKGGGVDVTHIIYNLLERITSMNAKVFLKFHLFSFP